MAEGTANYIKGILSGNLASGLNDNGDHTEDSAESRSLTAYWMYHERICNVDDVRRKIILALIAGNVGLITMLYRLPDMWMLWATLGFFGAFVCHQLEEARCRQMITAVAAGLRAEAKKPRGWATFYDKLDINFSRWKFTKGEWFILASVLIWLSVWVKRLIMAGG